MSHTQNCFSVKKGLFKASDFSQSPKLCTKYNTQTHYYID